MFLEAMSGSIWIKQREMVGERRMKITYKGLYFKRKALT